MRLLIGGVEPCSMVDYPGRLAAVVFCHGCQLRCGYCHNPELVVGRCRSPLREREVFQLLERRRGRLDGVVVSGGEPTLQPGLEAFLRRCGALGYARKLDTNGLAPECLEALVAGGLVEYVALDLKDLPGDYDRLLCGGVRPSATALRQSIAVLVESGVDHEVRTTVCAPHHDRARLRRMAGELSGVRRWRLQAYRPGGTLDPDCPWRPPEAAWRIQVVEDAAAEGVSARWR